MIFTLIIDENPIFCGILKKIVSTDAIQHLGQLYTGVQALAWFRQCKQPSVQKPDVILLNAQLPDMTGEVLSRYLHRHWPEIPLIFLLDRVHWPSLNRLVISNVQGFLTKESASYWCLDAIKTVQAGKTFLQPDIALEWLRYQGSMRVTQLEKLSTREYEVAMAMVKGRTYDEIAELLHISIKTIYNIKMRAFKKLNIQNQKQLSELMDFSSGNG